MSKRHVNCTPRFSYLRAVSAALGVIGGVLVAARVPGHAQEQAAAGEAHAIVARWIDRTPAKTAPQPKGSEDASLIYDPVGGRTLLYGGKDDDNFSVNETWAFDSAEHTWKRVTTTGKTPPASEDHTTIYDPAGHRMIMFGGENGPTTNKLWSLDLKTSAWKELTNAQTPRRESHSAVYDSRGKRMVVFGGLDRTRADLFEVWAMDLNPASPTFEKWQDITVAEGRAPGRIDHVAVYDPLKNRMVFHGGWMKMRQGLLGDTWAFYFGDSTASPGRWEKTESPTAPPPRRHADGVYDPDRNLFLLFGGQGRTSTPLNDVWALDLTRDVWMNITPPGPGPVARIDHQVVYDLKTHSMLLYGGDGMVEDAPKLHDVWELELPPVSSLSSTRGVQ
jgi:hypothetical protein